MIALIERRMQELGLSARSLAKAAGLAETYVRDLREGRSNNPRVTHLSALAEALGLTLADLVAGRAPGLSETSAILEPPEHDPQTVADDRFGQVAAAVDAMLREEQAPHDVASVATLTRIVWRDMLKLGTRMSFEDRLAFTLSERRSIVRAARAQMFSATRSRGHNPQSG